MADKKYEPKNPALTEHQQEAFMFGMMGSFFAGIIVWLLQKASSSKKQT